MLTVEGLSPTQGFGDTSEHAWEDTHDEEEQSGANWTSVNRRLFLFQVRRAFSSQKRQHAETVSETEELRQRLDNANNHFRWKAAEVFSDEDAVRLLIKLYQRSTIRIAEFDICQDGISLARLTAANFCEIGANLVYITEAGQGFIESLDQK